MTPLAWSLAGLALAVAAVAVAWALRATRARRRAEERAAATDAAELALARTEERTRIAREMHDVIAHTLSVVVAQADGGRLAARTDPTKAVHALETIADVSRAALTEVRGLLGVLRGEEGAAALGPQPTLEDIPALVASVRDGGLDVSLVTTGTPRPLPIGAGLAAYRTVQEGLTNVLKHAGPKATAYVQLEWARSGLGVVVSDDGRGAAAGGDGEGAGLSGLRERVAVFGGTLRAGPRRGGGYVVRASIPVGAPAEAAA